jgi:hypothetical protein
MLGVIVFVASFLLLFIISLVAPVPPGQLLVEVFGNAESSYSIAGISEELVFFSMINGLFWGVIIVVVFSYLRGPSKGKVNLPVWVPRYVTSGNSETEHKTSSEYDELSFKVARKPHEAEIVEIVGAGYSKKLGKIGITTLDDLIYVGATAAGRNYLVQKTGVSPSTILYWVQQAEARK